MKRYFWLKKFVKDVILSSVFETIIFLALYVSVVAAIVRFCDKDIETTTLTSVGFVVFIAVSNLCFSWVRALDTTNDTINSKKVMGIALDSIIAAILFLIGSGSKYFFLLAYNGAHKISILYYTYYVIFIISLASSFVIAAWIIYRLFKVYLIIRFNFQ
ncbi:hypothetical protein LJ707_16030 [Mucilaginibacter sp. UR6-1]|uniref:hypothetical protein n=1 Tax=Mucilaginibacter sp. UR6-1 TaxID=1435643 RepID=UPI001E45B953|nr:hypothetical protein [Mucilaginibacter sp. UR6-1]MCC8410452.1 hypothetical protein [Mucilaginibacter sp. UR6-1]